MGMERQDLQVMQPLNAPTVADIIERIPLINNVIHHQMNPRYIQYNSILLPNGPTGNLLRHHS
jgi:hypothetical protein